MDLVSPNQYTVIFTNISRVKDDLTTIKADCVCFDISPTAFKLLVLVMNVACSKLSR